MQGPFFRLKWPAWILQSSTLFHFSSLQQCSIQSINQSINQVLNSMNASACLAVLMQVQWTHC
jgi:hypothetical protein